jgi:hypothetical protein
MRNDVNITIDGKQVGIQFPDEFWRDYFAAAALQGWLTTYGEDTPHPGLDETNGKAYMKSLAQCSYEMANAMLAARKEGA